MATRTRDSSVPGKDQKRGTSTSNVPKTGRRLSSPVPTSVLAPSQKHVRNYLKPTLSSGLDASKQQAKKPVSITDSSNKPTPARRRSFDKPPTSSSHAQKPSASPIPTLRSSSFTGTAQKAAPDKNLKMSKDAGKQHTLYARLVNAVKKSNTGSQKQEVGRASSRTKGRVFSPPGKVNNPNLLDVPEPGMQSKDQESSSNAGAERQRVDIGKSNEEKGAKDSVLADQEPVAKESMPEDQEAVDIQQTDADNTEKEIRIVTVESCTMAEPEDAKIVAVESAKISEPEDVKTVTVESSKILKHQGEIATVENSTLSSEHQDASLSVKTGEADGISQKPEDLKEFTIEELNNTNSDESLARNASEEVDENGKEEEETTRMNEKEESASGSEAHASGETEVQKVVAEEKRAEQAASKTRMAQQKDSVLSNDVIEETASKLREQRKNKVRALAGAFETVISLQEPKS